MLFKDFSISKLLKYFELELKLKWLKAQTTLLWTKLLKKSDTETHVQFAN